MKNKYIIKVPAGTKYLSDFQIDNKKFELPNGILDKEMTGCGGTTLALEDSNKTIICCPRIKLLENKHAQFPETLIVKGGVDKTAITKYLEESALPKILVTYDSLPRVLDCIDDIENWRIVVDEFQCLLSDSAFKAEVELGFLKQVKTCPYVTYLSATPILGKWLDEISYFKDVNYYQLDWEEKTKAMVYPIKTNKPIKAVAMIVYEYLNGNYPSITLEDGTKVESKECVIFLNSVTSIVNLMKYCTLKPEQVNIIVAQNEDNQHTIDKLGKEFSIGTIPLKGEAHKMITMCTSTAYMGVDFYSECAATFVVGDPKMPNTAVDISMELCQIAGRQRLESNPFRNHITFIYNTCPGDISPEDFNIMIKMKEERTRIEIEHCNNLSELARQTAIQMVNNTRKTVGFYDSYTMYDSDSQQFVRNELAAVHDRYAYDVQQQQYQNSVVLLDEIANTEKFSVSSHQPYIVYNKTIAMTITNTAFNERMQQYCEYRQTGGLYSNLLCQELNKKDPKLSVYYDALGADLIQSLDYQERELEKEYKLINNKKKIQQRLYKQFKSGERILNPELKAIIQTIYNDLGLDRTAKATDIKLFGFTYKEVKIPLGNGERKGGLELIKTDTNPVFFIATFNSTFYNLHSTLKKNLINRLLGLFRKGGVFHQAFQRTMGKREVV